MYGLLGRLCSSEHKPKSLTETASFSEYLHGMATLKIPEVVPSPEQDSERLKNAFDGPPFMLPSPIFLFCFGILLKFSFMGL